MVLYGKTMWPWLIILRIHLFPKMLGASSTLLWPNDVQKFDADAILYGDTRCKKMDISMFLVVFSVRFRLESGKICKHRSTFFIFYTFFADILCFFLQGEGGTGKYRSPYQPSIWVLDGRAGQLYLTWPIRLGQKSSIKGNTSKVYDKHSILASGDF